MEEFEKAVSELRIKDVVMGSIITGLGLLVALTWRDTIQATINYLVPEGTGLSHLYAASAVVTVVAVTMGYILVRIQRANIYKFAANTFTRIPTRSNGKKKEKQKPAGDRVVHVKIE